MKNVKGINKYLGLMFKNKNTEPLIFTLSKPKLLSIHSLFVFFPFKAYWYNEKGELIESRIVKPFRINIKPSKPFYKLVEVPLS